MRNGVPGSMQSAGHASSQRPHPMQPSLMTKRSLSSCEVSPSANGTRSRGSRAESAGTKRRQPARVKREWAQLPDPCLAESDMRPDYLACCCSHDASDFRTSSGVFCLSCLFSAFCFSRSNDARSFSLTAGLRSVVGGPLTCALGGSGYSAPKKKPVVMSR